MNKINIKKVKNVKNDYLRDESRKIGRAKTISFPKSEQEVIEILKYMYKNKMPVTVQGARTGISGGASPEEGHILNLSKLNKITGFRYNQEEESFYLKVQPGVILSQIRKFLNTVELETDNWSRDSIKAYQILKKSRPYFFPPDPTEASASIGGMVACNASGSRSFSYGSTRKYVEELKVILINGDSFTLKRGQQKVKNRKFLLNLESGKKLKGILPEYKMPRVKNTAGLFVKENMDLIDLFIGSEGILGVITDITIKLIPDPQNKWGITVFFNGENKAVKFVRGLRNEISEYRIDRLPVAIEFFNQDSLNLLKNQKDIKVPEFPAEINTAIYLELHGNSNDELYNNMLSITKLIEACGGKKENSWVAQNKQDRERLGEFRHAVPEAVNSIIDKRKKENPELTKLGTDMAVPDRYLNQVLQMYNSSLRREGMDSVIFGHIGDNHLHVNILPRNLQEYHRGEDLYREWAEKIIKMDGTISAEHGVGKLKVDLLKKMLGKEQIKQLKELKKVFDKDMLLNPGTVIVN
ncbi:MAG: FAD-binding oxidoreductase [Bacillota bacterium]